MTAASNNTTLLQNSDINIQLMSLDPNPDFLDMEVPRRYTLTATTEPTQTGVATVTVTVQDKDGKTTSTAFALVVPTTGSPPSISNPADDNFEEQTSLTGSTLHGFTVADPDGNLNQLKVTAFSSNTNLVPNDFVHNLIVTPPDTSGVGHVEVVPNTAALPSPSPGPGKLPQAATITLSVTDDSYTQQTTFLYVLRDPSCPAASFSRPSGVYPTTKLNSPESYPFLTGPQYNLEWDSVEPLVDDFNFQDLNDYITQQLPLGEDLSLDLHREPCYIAMQSGVVTWCDTDLQMDEPSCSPVACTGSDGFERAVPWDPYLQQRWANYITMLAADLNTNHLMDKISIVNINLPGGDRGIINIMGCENFSCMQGYSRPVLLDAIEKDLRVVQDNFPGKFIQIGFYEVEDGQGPTSGGGNGTYTDDLWQWLYKDATADATAVDASNIPLFSLADEFDGIRRPRISFFQEDLSARRVSDPATMVVQSNTSNYITPANTTAYTVTPMTDFVPSFEYYGSLITNAEYNNGTTWQANTIWSNPFSNDSGLKLTKNINGSPNDAIEGAFNSFLSQYLEVYQDDMDAALSAPTAPYFNAELWAGELQSWHDYWAHVRNDITPLEVPAGLTVERASAQSNLVKWDPVYGAATYELQRADLGTPPVAWADKTDCTPVMPQCTDTTASGAQYGYRVRAKNADGTIVTQWAYVAVFLSEAVNDGYALSSYTSNNAAGEPGIRAGVVTGMGSPQERAILSFDTEWLSGGKVLGAKLRLYQTSNDDAYTFLGPCHVDIRKGAFNANVALEGADFDASATKADVARVAPLADDSTPGWVEAELIPLPENLSLINTSSDMMGHTQFRLYFNGTSSTKQAKWDSGDTATTSVDLPPQLIVQYQP